MFLPFLLLSLCVSVSVCLSVYVTVNVLVISSTVATAGMWVRLCANIFTVEK